MAIAAMRVPTIFVAVDRFSDVVHRMTANTRAFGATAEAAALRTSASFNSAGNKMLGAGLAIGTGLGFAVNEAVNFEDKMASINTILNATPEQMNKIKKTIFDVGNSTGVPLNDLVSNFYELSSAQIYGAKANEALNASARLSVLGLGDMTQSTNIMISVLNGFKREGIGANEVLENISRTIQKGKLKVADMNESFAKNGALVGLAGVKLKEYLAMQAAMTTAGLPVSEAQNALGLASINIVKMAPKMKKLFAGMGLKGMSGKEVVEHFGGLVPTMIKMGEQAKKVKVPIESVFGRQGAIVANALLTGIALKEYGIEMDYLAKKGINVSDAMFKIKQATNKFKFNIIKDELKELAITIGDAVLPRIKEMADSAIKMAKGVVTWAENNRGFANTLVTAAKWLLILGVAAKIGAALFYGLAKAIEFVQFLQAAYTTVTELCTVATYLAASGQATFAASLWAVASGLLAAYWPVLLVVAALGGLAYAFSDTSDSASSMVDKQLASLSKGNMAMMNSTGVMKDELAKQQRMMDAQKFRNLPDYKSSESDNPVWDKISSFFGNAITINTGKRAGGNEGVSASNYVKATPILNATRIPTYESTPENLAGKSQVNMADYMKNNYNGGELTVNLKTDSGVDAKVDGETPKGIKVVTKPNQGTR